MKFLSIGMSLVFALGSAGNATGHSGGTLDRFYMQGKNTPLMITEKPEADPRGCFRGEGKIVVRVTFDKSGKITEAKPISSSGCGSFDYSAVRAARAIKFKPEMKAGKTVTVIRPVEYTFSIH